MDDRLYIICTEDEQYGVTCRTQAGAFLWSIWLGWQTFLRGAPQRITTITVAAFHSKELEEWAQANRSWSPANPPRGEPIR